MMRWKSLLSRQRLAKPGRDPELPYRSAFEIDIDRITFSTSFRRLSDKQQVHGIGGSDYVRSRLTHSMEASRVGRSLGAWAGQEIINRYGAEEVGATPFDIGDIVAAAALSHDVGTPCFAHTGEDIVSDWFRTSDLGRDILDGLPDQQCHELTRFEGNAQGFRVLTRLQGWRPTGGLQLTAATLGAYSKYPWSAPAAPGEQRPHKRKYGFLGSEAELFRWVAGELGLVPLGRDAWCRHPLAYLVEAADDACYSIVDIEDAVKMRMLSFDEAEDLLRPVIDELDQGEYRSIDDEDRKLIYLRARAIDKLVHDAAAMFLERLPAIMEGKACPALLDMIERVDALKEIEEVSYTRIYRGQQRCETDIVAARTITTLLDAYGEAFLAREAAGPYGELPRRFSSLLETVPQVRAVPYDRAGWVRALLDYIAGMTDRFAIRQAQLIAG
ncbi:dNTP triphosphohydrolase [Aerophototrophica crusticola]|uniref:DNTP triphosphohydrolase n=1 Tax=Aerophototrophica crusticola TaxID=1709002 RepID=A0A858R623_9PROT|nr:dNTP triphosphohydrolase [Rhodospirillaceae bacterium B3]